MLNNKNSIVVPSYQIWLKLHLKCKILYTKHCNTKCSFYVFHWWLIMMICWFYRIQHFCDSWRRSADFLQQLRNSTTGGLCSSRHELGGNLSPETRTETRRQELDAASSAFNVWTMISSVPVSHDLQRREHLHDSIISCQSVSLSTSSLLIKTSQLILFR